MGAQPVGRDLFSGSLNLSVEIILERSDKVFYPVDYLFAVCAAYFKHRFRKDPEANERKAQRHLKSVKAAA